MNKQDSAKEKVIINNGKIRDVTFEYIGTEEDLDNFLRTVIIDYCKRKKLIVE